MSSTRYPHQPMQIYQDAFDQAPMPSMETNSKKPSPLRPIKNAASRKNIILNPPQNSNLNPSPLKPIQPNIYPSRAPFGDNFNMVSMPAPGGPSYNTDSMEKRETTDFQAAPQKALFTTFVNSNPMEKEIYPQPFYEEYSYNNFSLDDLYGVKQNKRALMEAAPIESRPSKKPKVVKREEDVRDFSDLPAPESSPDIMDDGSKPTHSYAQLIGMAILRTPTRRLTLSQIYKWISETYAFYNNKEETGWQNSIRHNLSLNKAFIKQERPKDDPGKGNYWAIEPGMEHQFIKEKSFRKSSSNENIFSNTLEPVELESSQPLPDELPSSEPEQFANEPSSDATIPASDVIEALSSPLLQSSPPMHSSPVAHGTPPPVPRFPTSSAVRSHKRKFASMDDSGYFSSLDSSAMRSRIGDRFKRGRAEEEIARLKGSSYDSPTRRVMLSSSPRGKMLPPLTPAVKLKPPVRAPPSNSPNTNLRMHREKVRELVGSPLKGMLVLDDGIPWSPEFNLETTKKMFTDFGCTDDVFQNLDWSWMDSPKPAKRPRLDRSKSTNVLGDITNTSNPIKFTPLPPAMPSPPKFSLESPTRGLGIKGGMMNYMQDDFLGAEFLTEEIDEFTGMDITQGFQKIGSRNTPRDSRPALGRSMTSRF